MDRDVELSGSARERRRFLRIEDDLIFNYRLADAAAAAPAADRRQAALRAALVGLDGEVSNTIAELRERSVQVGDVLDYLNNKLSLLSRLLVPGAEAAGWHEGGCVDLSAGGMAFDSRTVLALGTLLELEMVLLPSCAVVSCGGEVVDSREAGDHQRISVRFLGLTERQEDTIVRHVFRKHGEQLQRRRSGAAPDSP